MAVKNKSIFISLTLILIAVLIYLGLSFYGKKQLISELPELPQLGEAEFALNESFSEAFQNVKNNTSAKNIGALGMVFHANNYFKEAEACYELAIAQDSKDWKWNYYLGCIKREQGNSEDAITHFKDVLKVNPKSHMTLYYLGESYQQLDSIKKAEQILKEISGFNKSQFAYSNTKRTAYFPLPLYARLQLSKLYTNNSKTDKGIEELKTLVEENINFGPAYRQLSNIYGQLGNEELRTYYSNRANDLNIYMSPVDTLVDALSLKSRSETYLLKQIDDAIRSSNSHWALELLNLGLESIPNSKYLISKGIKHYIDMNATNRALPLLEKHVRHFKDNYQEIIEVGVGLSSKGFKKETLNYFKIAEKINGTNASAKATLAGMYFEKLGMKDKAVSLINELLEKHPNSPEVKSAAIFLFLKTEDIAKAKLYLSKLEKQAPLYKDIHVFKGILAQREKKAEVAVKHYEKALKANPEKKFIINYLRTYYTKNQKWEKAIWLYKTVLENTPNDSDIQEAYGSLLLSCPNKELRNLELAKEFSERAFINKVYTLPTRLEAGRSLAIALFELNSHGKAIYYMNKTIDMAKRAGANKQYVFELEGILRDFQNIASASQ
ncbi:tetratricopeptide repeat protein [Seonamhaeicola marinus]|uniref:Tetratricopeptide repeat protein n=1 Tax=Seonamhaeicola marinus TaxID=1912246 RepID=A0A5D0IMQ8_9FLAO|nr:tetratricopeptide repeat protein [Seonamhaeicola marinus]TYA84301.1 tetratricopeptide repeat protein [Seonamhaeicola marinus]